MCLEKMDVERVLEFEEPEKESWHSLNPFHVWKALSDILQTND